MKARSEYRMQQFEYLQIINANRLEGTNLDGAVSSEKRRMRCNYHPEIAAIICSLDSWVALQNPVRAAQRTTPRNRPARVPLPRLGWGLQARHLQSPKPRNPEKSQKVSRKEFGTPRPRTPEKFRKKSEKSEK